MFCLEGNYNRGHAEHSVCRIRLRRKGQRGEEHDSRAGKRKKWITDKDSGDGLHGEPRQRRPGGRVED